MILLLIVLALVALAVYVLAPAVRHLHLPGCSERRAVAQATEPKSEGDLYQLAERSADGMAFRYAFANVRDTVRHRARLVPTNPRGDRVEIRVVAREHEGRVYGPPGPGGVRPVLVLKPGLWVTECDKAGRATASPRWVRS